MFIKQTGLAVYQRRMSDVSARSVFDISYWGEGFVCVTETHVRRCTGWQLIRERFSQYTKGFSSNPMRGTMQINNSKMNSVTLTWDTFSIEKRKKTPQGHVINVSAPANCISRSMYVIEANKHTLNHHLLRRTNTGLKSAVTLQSFVFCSTASTLGINSVCWAPQCCWVLDSDWSEVVPFISQPFI